MFAIVSMNRITGVEISKKSQCVKQTAIWKSLKTLQTLYTLCAMFARVSMMHITGGEISKKSKCAKQTANSKSLKTMKILYTLCAPCRKWWY